MKNIKLKALLATMLMAVVVVSAPLTSFAESHANIKNNNKTKIEVKNNKSSSAWNRLRGLFASRAQAAIDASSMPTISGITAPTVLKTGEMGTWAVKASDPNNGSLSYAVDWGETTSDMKSLAAEPVFVQTSTFTHAYATAGTYTVKFTVSNEADLKATSTVTVHVVGSSASAPVISDVTASSTKPHQATVSWTTDVRSSSLVWYGKTSPVDTSGTPNISRSAKVLNHKINLNKLEPETTYYVIVGSKNGVGTTLSSETSFTTTATADNTTPVITGLTGKTPIAVGETETVTINAYDPKNGSLTYTADWGDADSTMKSMNLMTEDPFVQTSTFTHVYSEPGTYKATFTAENAAGKKASASMTIEVIEEAEDTVAPVIAPHDNETATATLSTGIAVDYTAPEVTDNVDATTAATCLPASGSVFPIGVTTVLCNHTDSSGNEALETSFTVTVTDGAAPVVSNMNVVTEATKSTITWTTDEASKSKIYYGTTTPLDINASGTLSVTDDSAVTEHSVEVTGLSASTLYYFVVESSDALSNKAVSSESTFTTLAS